MSLQTPIVPPDTLSKVVIIDEAWNVLPVPHSAWQFIRHGAKRLGNQTPAIITAMPADYQCYIADAVFHNTTKQPAGVLAKEYV